MIRTILSRLCASYYRVRSRGRMQGSSFLLRRPSTLRIGSGGSIRLGKDVHIDKDARIVANSTLVIGDDTFIGKNSTVIVFAPLTIGSNVLLGENVSLHTENHGPAGSRDLYAADAIVVEDRVWIGAGAVVTKGVRIGAGATVGANAVVTHDVEPGATVVGVPARPLRARVGDDD